MIAYKHSIIVVDFEGNGQEEITYLLKDNKYCNVSILDIKEKDIGEWSDDHPLNNKDTQVEYCEKVFN
jgi:hypothetical protein